MRVIFSNSFSLNMLEDEKETKIVVKKLSLNEVKQIMKDYEGCEWLSCIGHTSTAMILSELLQKQIDANRIAIKLRPNDLLVVFQILVRIEEGKVLSREELEKVPYAFYLVKLQ